MMADELSRLTNCSQCNVRCSVSPCASHHAAPKPTFCSRHVLLSAQLELVRGTVRPRRSHERLAVELLFESKIFLTKELLQICRKVVRSTSGKALFLVASVDREASSWKRHILHITLRGPSVKCWCTCASFGSSPQR